MGGGRGGGGEGGVLGFALMGYNVRVIMLGILLGVRKGFMGWFKGF